MGSKEVAAAALTVAVTPDRDSESAVKLKLREQGLAVAAVDFGGDFIGSINRIIEHAIVAAKRERLIGECHAEEGAVAGAAREAISQIMPKAVGLNVGGKIAVARGDDHISVAAFFAVGLVHLNEIAVGLGHRALGGKND